MVEEGVHRTVTEDCHVCDAVGSGDHAGYQGSVLAAGVGSFVGLIGRSVRYRAQREIDASCYPRCAAVACLSQTSRCHRILRTAVAAK